MKYVDEFRSKRLIDKLAGQIRRQADTGRTYNIMEVCGTHTMSIFRFGLKEILPENIRLISGPGCPVCVTPNEYLDKAIAISGLKDVIIATFGDMLKVPGSHSSLDKEKAGGANIRGWRYRVLLHEWLLRDPGAYRQSSQVRKKLRKLARL